ncbi:HPP family protein [Thiomicrorhabdus sp. Milos-T2]|uniref:CBS domain-containing protein n=1 Tax=Thiomicrorhabdus sp. Milos-T2 TaxID=90814 RepID=UPI000493BAEC|nr:CBS domain-containing protein [Thiomicrorhabdus sp. Milos-T2]
MFIVYSPEGQSFIGAVQNLPVLKVDPAKRINKVEQSELGALKTDIESKSQSNPKNSALNAYKQNQSTSSGKAVVKVAEVMVSPVVTINVNASLEEAWQIMHSKKIKHLPVLNNAELVGMCSQENLLTRIIVGKSGELEGVKPEKVVDVMHTEVVTTNLDTDIRHVAQALNQYQIDALVIMSEYHQIIGIVTESDLIRRLAKEPPIEIYT